MANTDISFEELLEHLNTFAVLQWPQDEKFVESEDGEFIKEWLIANRKYHFSTLKDAKIKVLFKKDLGSRGSQAVLGQARAQNDLQRKINPDVEFILLLNFKFWNDLTNEYKVILVDHELMHMNKQYTDRGVKIGCDPHDFEEFVAILRQYGEEKVLKFHNLTALMLEQKKEEAEDKKKEKKASKMPEGLDILDEG